MLLHVAETAKKGSSVTVHRYRRHGDHIGSWDSRLPSQTFLDSHTGIMHAGVEVAFLLTARPHLGHLRASRFLILHGVNPCCKYIRKSTTLYDCMLRYLPNY